MKSEDEKNPSTIYYSLQLAFLVRFNGRRFHTVLCCDLCSVPHSQCDCVPEYLHHQYGPKQEKQHIMQQRHVYSVAGTTGSV